MMAALFLSLWLGVCGFALWRGGQPERLVASLFLLAFVLSVLADRRGYLWHGLQLGAFVIDLALLLALTMIAMRANRYWPIGMAGMQLLQVGGHLLKLADPRMLPLAYWLSAAFWAYPMLILLALGTVRHRNRERNQGPEPSWSSSSPRPG